MTYRYWSPAEDRLLRQRFPFERTRDTAARLNRTESAVSVRAKHLGLRKSPDYLTGAGRFQRGSAPTSTRFKPGAAPWNKGRKGSTGLHPHCVATHFRKGEVNGRAAQLLKPVGFERISKDGYLERKVNTATPRQRRWRAVHLLLWEAAHGALPPSHAVGFRTGDKTDIRLDNLALVTRADLMRRNTHHGRLPPELSRLIQLRGALNRKINARTTP